MSPKDIVLKGGPADGRVIPTLQYTHPGPSMPFSIIRVPYLDEERRWWSLEYNAVGKYVTMVRQLAMSDYDAGYEAGYSAALKELHDDTP